MYKILSKNKFNNNDLFIPIGYALGFRNDKTFTIQTHFKFIELKDSTTIFVWTRIKNGLLNFSDLLKECVKKDNISISDFEDSLNNLIDLKLIIKTHNDAEKIYDSIKHYIPISQGYGLGHTDLDPNIFIILQNNDVTKIHSSDSLLWVMANGFDSYEDIYISANNTAIKNNLSLNKNLKESLGLSTITCLKNNLIYIL